MAKGLAIADRLLSQADPATEVTASRALTCHHCGKHGSEDSLTEMVNSLGALALVCRRKCYQLYRQSGYIRRVMLTHPVPGGFQRTVRDSLLGRRS